MIRDEIKEMKTFNYFGQYYHVARICLLSTNSPLEANRNMVSKMFLVQIVSIWRRMHTPHTKDKWNLSRKFWNAAAGMPKLDIIKKVFVPLRAFAKAPIVAVQLRYRFRMERCFC